MDKINIRSLIGEVEINSNRVIREVNDHCIRLAVNEDSIYGWHFHPDSDELFLVLEGTLILEFREAPEVVLNAGDLYKVPARVIHRTVSKGRTANLCFESTRAETAFVR